MNPCTLEQLELRLKKFTLASNEKDCSRVIGANNRGYAVICFDKVSFYVHRLRFALANNLDYHDESWDTMHSCDIRSCIKLEHLSKGNDSLNMLDAVAKGRHAETMVTHCPRGHEYSGENVIVTIQNKRICRECRKETDRIRNQGRITINGIRTRIKQV